MPKRRDLIKLAGLGPLAFLPPAAAAPLANKVMPAKEAKLTREPFGDLAIYFEGATDQIRSMTAGSLRLKPGMEPHPPHQHPEEEFLLFTEGTGEVTIEGKPSAVAPGSMLYCAGNRLHGVKNTGKVPLLFYFYKWKA
jgi:quercetin dioxygenase-like cupin family protein